MSSGFISEADALKLREQRQKEWERVRTAEQPLEAPEEPQDCRSLYDKLQDAKNKKQEEWEESRKFKNLIKNLDEDECTFLERVDNSKVIQSRRIADEERRELAEFRQAQMLCDDSAMTRSIQHLAAPPAATTGRAATTAAGSSRGRGHSTQSRLMAAAVFTANQRCRSRQSRDAHSPPSKRSRDHAQPPSKRSRDHAQPPSDHQPEPTTEPTRVQSVLPGMGCYDSSSDSASESESTNHMSEVTDE